MLFSPPYWVAVAVIHGLWAGALPGRQIKAVGAAGAVVALTLAVVARLRAGRRGIDRRDVWWLLPFLFPIAAFAATPMLAFWRVDARAWLTVAWLIVATRAVLATEESGDRALPAPVGLFLLWTSVFWLMMVWDVGLGSYLMTLDPAAVRSEPLTVIFRTWESHPMADHLFVSWRYEGNFEERLASVNHVHLYLLSMYAWVSAVRAVLGVPLEIARFSVPFLYIFVLLATTTTLLARLGLLREVRDARALLVLFLAWGFLVTTWRFWRDLLMIGGDNTFPLVAALFVLVYAAMIPPARPRLALVSGVVFVALGPLHLPILIVTLACMFGQYGAGLREIRERNRLIVRICAWAAVAGIVSTALPRLLVAWKGYIASGTSFLFRSGLDGDTTYYTSVGQALWSPNWPRPLLDLLVPAFVPIAVAAPWLWRTADPWGAQVGRLLLFLTTLYFASLAFFPQSVSIHPYLYELVLIIPVVIAGMVVMLIEPVRLRLTGGWLLLFLLGTAYLLIANLTAIAQFVRHPLPHP